MAWVVSDGESLQEVSVEEFVGSVDVEVCLDVSSVGHVSRAVWVQFRVEACCVAAGAGIGALEWAFVDAWMGSGDLRGQSLVWGLGRIGVKACCWVGAGTGEAAGDLVMGETGGKGLAVGTDGGMGGVAGGGSEMPFDQLVTSVRTSSGLMLLSIRRARLGWYWRWQITLACVMAEWLLRIAMAWAASGVRWMTVMEWDISTTSIQRGWRGTL